MKRLTLAVLTAASLSGFFAIAQSAATACTPHPDNPDGCNNWPPRRIKVEDIKLNKPFPWPGPVCLSCPPNLVLREELVQKERFEKNIRHLPQGEAVNPGIVRY